MSKSQQCVHSKWVHSGKHMTHTEGKAEHLELIFLGRMSPAGQGYPQHFLLPLGYESLWALSLQTQILNKKNAKADTVNTTLFRAPCTVQPITWFLDKVEACLCCVAYGAYLCSNHIVVSKEKRKSSGLFLHLSTHAQTHTAPNKKMWLDRSEY